MNEKEKKIYEQINKLRTEINHYNSLYFEKSQSDISDFEYDKKLKLLEKLEHNYFYLFTQEENENSPTQKVAPLNFSVFQKYKHSKKMLSLNKAYSFEELQKFINDAILINNNQNVEFYLEPKIDGLSIAIYYNDGKLVKALTRGNGIEGEDVTENVLKMSSNFIKQTIDYTLPLEIRGEIFLFKKDFKKLNSLDNNQENNFSNPRNAASGILRRKKDLNNNISFLSSFFYQIIDPEKHNLKTYEQGIKFLKNLNIPTIELGKKIDNLNDIFKQIEYIEQVKNNLNFQIDGCVIKINDFNLFNLSGQTSKFPKGAIAYKFYDEIAVTKLLDIEYQIGRTGKLAYVAKLKPVLLNGTKVSKTYLHNYQNILNLKINLNEEVKIKKAGEIIPQIIESVKHFDKSNIKILENCPFCNQPLKNTEKEQFCLNSDCQAIILRKTLHFFSKEAINIDTLSLKTIENLYKNKIITSIYDIFFLKDKLKELNDIGFRNKSSQKLLKSIENCKNTTFEKFIYALGIKNIGLRNTKLLVEKVKTIDEFINYDYDKLINVKNIGPIIVEEIKNFLSIQNNIEFLNQMKTIDFNFSSANLLVSEIFKNEIFVITGILTNPRNYYKSIIEANGGQVSSSVNASTTILLTGENPGSKLEKAKKLNIKIINEEEFNKKLN
ncbi:NAD-dependent DNA ligase LigA [[Mycoplasma] collis]|uniref:NAD-dependent DNA ligase LigA n=1 Tax=[Mycoplasma] collis TaxID=2127 RepID=UPI00051B14EB|nr:NAD-dependent DNA ligase LigA [[Mycoplasma] collis]